MPILKENTKALSNAAVFLILFGLILVPMGYSSRNYSTAFMGFTFSLLSLIGFFAIKKERADIAKILWAVGSPLIIFISPLLFSLEQITSIVSYSYLYAGAMLYSSYSLQGKEEKKILWLNIVFTILAMLFYDTIIIRKNFMNHPDIGFIQNNFIHYKITQLLHFGSLIFFILMVHSNKVRIEKKLSESIIKLKNFTTNLISSAKSKLIHSGDLVKALEEILSNTAQVLEVSRISVWEFDESDQSINLIVCYDAVKKEYTYSGKLYSKDYPEYFKSLLEEKIIAANNALTDPSTYEFKDSYLIPLGIKSMLDSPFFIDQKFKGVLCCEEQRSFRNWDEMDQLFSMSISKMLSIAYYCCIRKDQYKAILENSKEIELKNIDIFNINQQLMKINGDLSNNIFWKEEELKDLKKFIDDVSYKNSHHVRGPLSRILGLLHLYQNDPVAENKKLYMNYLNKSALELDDIIREMSQILHKGSIN